MNIAPSTAAAPRAARGSADVAARGIRRSFDAVAALAGVDLDAPAGTIVALLGPSGCGKTTLLRVIAGLESPDAGEVSVGGVMLTGPGVSVPPERRRIGMVFQDWALFPHLSVARNVGFGLPRRERRSRRVDEALEMVGLPGFGDRLPHTLSGGQKQRVALARAVAPQPSVLLLDEPFSNLDTSLRVQVRTEVHRLLRDLGITTIFVTHDQDEAFVLGDQVAVMRDGRIEQQATPAVLYADPATPWVAAFVGDANFVGGEAGGTTAVTPLGRVPLRHPTDGRVDVLLRPEELRVEAGSSAIVELVEFYGHDTVYVVRVGDRVLRARVGSAPEFSRGDRVEVRYAGRPTVAFPSG